jgi:phosphoglycolate phosphatase
MKRGTVKYISVWGVHVHASICLQSLMRLEIKAVVFDLDGTLASFNLDFKTLRAEVRGYLMNAGVPASVLTVNESIFEMLKKTEIFVRNSCKSRLGFGKIRDEALAIAEKYELEAARTTSLLPGVMETLRALKKMKLKIGLFTINGEKSTATILRRLKLAEFFDVTVPRNKVDFVKPHPEHLEVTLKALGVSAENTIVVGDSINDMRSAKGLKALAVGMPTGVSTTDQLKTNGANYIITSITDLPVLIEKLDVPQDIL